jgi:hypothetical protein
MRASLLCLLLSAASTLVACGGAVAPQSDDQQSTGSGKSSGGTTGSTPGTVSSSGTSGCTPGAYVFCRCADRTESTKLCRKDGTFDACSCGAPPPEPPACSYPPTKNPPGCPASYSSAYQGQPCAPLNLDCAYPGAGDFDANGCAATAGLWCRLGPGGDTTVWYATQ